MSQVYSLDTTTQVLKRDEDEMQIHQVTCSTDFLNPLVQILEEELRRA